MSMIEAGIQSAGSLATAIIEELLERSKNKRAVTALTSALAMEISELMIAIGRRREWWEREVLPSGELSPVQPWLPPLLPFYTEAFDQLRVKLDKLPRELVAPVVRFYGYLRFANGQAGTQEVYTRNGKLREFHSTYAKSLGTLEGIGKQTLEAFARFLRMKLSEAQLQK